MIKINYIIIFVFSLFVWQVYSADFYNIWNNSIQCINEHWVNRAIENKIWSSLFVPTKTSIEWATFRANKPSNVFEFTTSWNTWSWWTCSANPTWSSWWWWSSCTATCWWWTQTRSRTCSNTTWMQSRSVTCRLNDWRTQIDSCCTWIKPSTNQSCTWNCTWPSTETITCNTQACYTYSWHLWEWGACSRSCDGGTQHLNVTCRRSDWATVNDSFCSWTKPFYRQECNVHSCAPTLTYSWHIGTWGRCNTDCGYWLRFREVVCRGSNWVTVNDSFCTWAKPRSLERCHEISNCEYI